MARSTLLSHARSGWSRWIHHPAARPRSSPRRRPAVEWLESRRLLDGASAGVSVAFSVTSDWQTGFGASVGITNTGPTTINGWSLEFDFAPNIDTIWNAQIVQHAASHYVLRDAGYNQTITPGSTVSFGFNGSPGNVTTHPTTYVFNGVPVGSAPSLPTVSISDASTSEGNSGTRPLVFTLSLSAAAAGTVTVSYATANLTATAGSDYQAASGTVSFSPGQSSQTITVPIQGDLAVEPNEQFLVRLSGPSGATLGQAEAKGTILDDDATAPVGKFNYGEALQKALFFYQAQRSGDLPAGYVVDWRGDSGMNDGRDVGVDLTGGYYDAGDHVKFGLPMAYSMTMLAWGATQYRDAYARGGQLDEILAELKWGADYLVKAHSAPNVFWGQVGRGDLDHTFWGAPEVMPTPRPSYKIDAQHPGSDLAGQAAAALAAIAMAFQPTDPAYATMLLTHAEQLYSFADTYRGKYSDSITDAASYYNSYSGYHDELVWGAIWLYRATGKTAYLTKAESLYAQYFAGQTMTWTQTWDDSRYGAAVLLAQATGKDVYKRDVERWLDYWSVGTNGGATRIAYTPGGLAFLNGWGSLRYSATTAFLALVYGDTVRDYGRRYHDFALGQINYILGDNPRSFSYMVGFGTSYPRNPHHRGASGVWDGDVANPTPNRHILYGALVGGPESADDFNYHDDRANYISNEVALDYNAGLTGALARLYQEYGGDPLPSWPIPEPRDREFFVEASINQQGSTFTEIRALLNNRSAWPARTSSALSFRYFVDLSEVYNAGFTVNDVVVQSYYSQGATLSGLLPWDASRRIYYVDVSFAGVPIGPGPGTFAKEAQVRVGLKSGLPASAWDPTNDWSYQGLAVGRDRVAPTTRIPVYENGSTPLYGQTPGTVSPGTPGLSVEGVSATEGNSGASVVLVPVRLSQPSTSTVTVAYTTADGTAKAGSDYVAVSGTVSFAPGVTSRTIAVSILGDLLAEGIETFTVSLSSPAGAVIDAGQATVTILDDEPAPAQATVSYAVKDDWGTGFIGEITIRNTSTTAINGWTIAFDLAVSITNIWNAQIVSRAGNRYVIRAMSYNSLIAPGGSVTFGFQASPGNPPRTLSNVLLNGGPVSG
jgi:endoglucanase